MKKDDRRTLLVVGIVIVACSFIVLFFSRKSNFAKLSLVSDYNSYFSVSSEVDQYIGYIASGNKVNTLNVLNDNYVATNNIDYNNVFNFVGNYRENSALDVSSMSFVNIGKDYLYLVEGKIVDLNYYSTDIVDNNFKVIVFNDISNNTYSILPINDDNYKKIINHTRRINIDGNSSNAMIDITKKFTDVDICKLYFSNYVSTIYNDRNEAYELLSDGMKERFPSISDFNKYIDENMNIIVTSSKLCGADLSDDRREYNVIDSNDNYYKFIENGVMNYKVNFNFKTVEDND